MLLPLHQAQHSLWQSCTWAVHSGCMLAGYRVLTRVVSDMATWHVWLMKLTIEAVPIPDAPHMRKHAPHQPKLSGRHATHRNLQHHAAYLSTEL